MPQPETCLTSTLAEALALELMRQHGLTRKGWVFDWSSGKRRLGETSILKSRDPKTRKINTLKRIRLSRHLVSMNPEPVVRDVILHEIAHALAGLKNGHNEVWQAMCIKVGAKPQRLADETVEVVASKYAIVCTLCKRGLAHRHRCTSPAHLAKAYCKFCGPDALGKLKMAKIDADKDA